MRYEQMVDMWNVNGLALALDLRVGSILFGRLKGRYRERMLVVCEADGSAPWMVMVELDKRG